MKKILALILAALMLFSLVACAAKPAEEPSQTQDETPAAQPAESTDEATPEEPETEEPAETTEADLSGTVTIYSTQTDVDHEVFLQVFNAHYPNVMVPMVTHNVMTMKTLYFWYMTPKISPVIICFPLQKTC